MTTCVFCGELHDRASKLCQPCADLLEYYAQKHVYEEHNEQMYFFVYGALSAAGALGLQGEAVRTAVYEAEKFYYAGYKRHLQKTPERPPWLKADH